MGKITTLLWSLGLAVLAAGAWLVCPQQQCAMVAVDDAGLRLAQDMRSATLDRWMQGITWLGSLAVLLPLTAITALALLRLRRRPEAVFLVMAVLGASALSHLVKLGVMRPRPDLFPVWTSMPADWSYPSAHAMQITALAVAVFFIIRQRRLQLPRWIIPLAIPLGGIVLLVGASRIYLQVHFPTDVIAGVLAAALWVGGLHTLLFGRSSGHEHSQITGAKP